MIKCMYTWLTKTDSRGTEVYMYAEVISETGYWHAFINASWLRMLLVILRICMYNKCGVKCANVDVCEWYDGGALHELGGSVSNVHMERRWIAIFTCIKHAMLTMNYVVFTFILMHLTNTGKGICIFDTIAAMFDRALLMWRAPYSCISYAMQ